ncbi:MAG: DUF2807 domain-containing protein [Muribaculaceae bacterium]|nr:DUF2807 domain-containing protein [Muribaculaceae bacterium]
MKAISATLFLSAIALASCSVTNRVVPSQDFVTFEVAANDVNSIDVSSSIKVEYTQSDKVSVSVNCPENLVDYLDVKVKNGKLDADFKNGISIDGNSSVTITVSSPALSDIDASSSSSVIIQKSIMVTDELDIEASSSATVYIASVTRGNVSIDASTSSSVTIDAARCASLDIDSSTSASVTVSAIECVSVDAEASTAANVTLSGKTVNASYEASTAATINASALVADKLRSAKASSAANIRCAAETRGSITEESSGTVSF